jgi:para-nitrobenzyl esterase
MRIHLAMGIVIAGAAFGCKGTVSGTDVGGNAPSPTCPTQVQAAPGIVITAEGPIQGTAATGAYSYLGIPYATPPVGPHRWQPATAPACRSQLLNASAFGNICPQLNSMMSVVGDEDCLTMNIWTPNPARQHMPVLVFFHGGGNHSGSSVSSTTAGGFSYDGTGFVAHGVIFVSFNYRLGALGYLAHPAFDAESPNHISGNYGLSDQLQALQWIHENISAFGGDPNAVTLMGSSVGSTAIAALMASPHAAGLFQRAILDSVVEGGVLPSLSAFEQGTGAKVVKAAGCDGGGSSSAIAQCLRGLTAAAVVSAVPGKIDIFPRIYTPNVDGYLLSASPLEIIKTGNYPHMPIIIGSNSAETISQINVVGNITDDTTYQAAVATVFGATNGPKIVAQYPTGSFSTPKAAFAALTTDGLHLCPSRRLARAIAAQQSQPLFRFLFTHAFDNDPTLHALGPAHVFEMPFVFGFNHAVYMPSAGETALSNQMVAYWTRFAVAADPNDAGATPWPRFATDSDSYLQLETTIAAGAGIRTSFCDFWDGL